MEHLINSENFNPIRVDKNVAFNISTFRNNYLEDSKLLKAILLYMAINHQEEDLFGFCKIDPKEFAKTMKLTESHLFKLHPSPFFLKDDPNARVLIDNEQKHGRMSKHRTWSNCLENALYILTHRNIIDNYRYKQGDKSLTTTKRFNFLDEIRFELVKTGKTKKILYYYKPNKIYEENLKSYFLNTKVQKYIKLKKPKLDEAYLDLLNRINNANQKGLNSLSFNIDTLAEIMQIKKYSRFSAYKKKVTEKFELLRSVVDQDIPGFSLVWGAADKNLNGYIDKIDKNKKSRKQESIPIISWSRETQEQKNNRKKILFNNLFYTELNRELIKAFFNIDHKATKIIDDEEQKKSAFYTWVFSNQNLDVKEIKFKDVYVDVYKNTINIESKTRSFIEVLKYLSKIKKDHNCIYYEEGFIHLLMNKQEYRFKHLYQLIEFFESTRTK